MKIKKIILIIFSLIIFYKITYAAKTRFYFFGERDWVNSYMKSISRSPKFGAALEMRCNKYDIFRIEMYKRNKTKFIDIYSHKFSADIQFGIIGFEGFWETKYTIVDNKWTNYTRQCDFVGYNIKVYIFK